MSRIGPFRSSNAVHPSTSRANQIARTIVAAIRTAITRIATSGHSHAIAARTAMGTAQAAIAPTTAHPSCSCSVSATRNITKNRVESARRAKPVPLRIVARVSASRSLIVKKTITTTTTAAISGKSMSHLLRARGGPPME
jgi:hypothetical protein